MQMRVFSVFDSKAEIYGMPFFMPNIQMAKRAFADYANDATTNVGKHPEDYTLFELGLFDDNNGRLTAIGTPVSHGLAINAIVPKPVVDSASNGSPVLIK